MKRIPALIPAVLFGFALLGLGCSSEESGSSAPAVRTDYLPYESPEQLLDNMVRAVRCQLYPDSMAP